MKSNVIFVALMLFLGWSLSSCNDEVVGTFHTNSDQIGGNLRLMRYMTADEWELE